MTQRTMRAALTEAFAAIQAGRFAEARDRAAPFRAGDAGAALLHALGQAGAGEPEAAAAGLDAIARANPGARHPALDAADLLLRAFRPGDAADQLRRALDHHPADPALWTGLGAALSEEGTVEGMVDAFRRAAALRPAAAEWSNLGKALAASGDEAAEDAFGRAAALAPHDPQLRLNRAVALLRAGRPEGWPLFRARHALPGRRPPPPGPELSDLGDLDALPGRRVVLLHDEGFGDTFQFLRFLPRLVARGASVAVAAPPPLHRLLRDSFVPLADGPEPGALWCRIPDLPALFAGEPDAVPPPFPFRARSAARPEEGERRFGLVWAGASRGGDPGAVATDRVRSLSPARLGPLLAVPGIAWTSLQAGQPAPPGTADAMAGVRDWADTAGIIAGLDGVVSVDTAVAHLAASMGRKVLLLDRFDHCWRWPFGRTETPWYPGTVSIIRQDSPGGWDGALRRAVAALEKGDEAWSG